MNQGYLIPAETHRVSMTVSNSRFLATAAYAPSVEEAKAQLATVRAEMPDATHHVYAYRVGYGKSIIEGMSDDGEPSGTSGPPTLAVVRGSNIGDIIVVVTRYFGGTLLGTGGLVRAYGDATRLVLSTLKTVRKIERTLIGIALPYPHYQPVRRLIEQYEGQIDEETFAGDVMIMASFPSDRVSSFSSAVVDITNGSVEPIVLD